MTDIEWVATRLRLEIDMTADTVPGYREQLAWLADLADKYDDVAQFRAWVACSLAERTATAAPHPFNENATRATRFAVDLADEMLVAT